MCGQTCCPRRGTAQLEASTPPSCKNTEYRSDPLTGRQAEKLAQQHVGGHAVETVFDILLCDKKVLVRQHGDPSQHSVDEINVDSGTRKSLLLRRASMMSRSDPLLLVTKKHPMTTCGRSVRETHTRADQIRNVTTPFTRPSFKDWVMVDSHEEVRVARRPPPPHHSTSFPSRKLPNICSNSSGGRSARLAATTCPRGSEPRSQANGAGRPGSSRAAPV